MSLNMILIMEKFLLILFIILIPFQDSGLQKFSRYLGQYLSNWPLIILILLEFYKCIFIKKYLKKIYLKYFIIISIYISIISVIPMLSYLDSHYIDKIIYTFFVNYSIFFAKCFILLYIIKNFKNIYFKYIVIAYLITLIGFFICDVIGFSGGFLVHYSDLVLLEEKGRARGFSSEPSFFGYTLVIFTLLTMYYIKKRWIKFIVFVISSIVLWIAGSKGSLIIVFFVGLLYVVKAKANFFIKCIILLVCLSAGAYLWINLYVYALGFADGEGVVTTISFVTRIVTILISIFILINYPLGIGISGVFGIYFLENMTYVYDIFSSIFFNGVTLDGSELFGMLNQGTNAYGVGIKSGFFQNVAYFGWPFICMFIYYTYKMNKYLNKKNEILLWIVFIYSTLSIMTYVTIGYETILLWGIILSNQKNM